MSCSLLDHAAIDAGVLATFCGECRATPGTPCMTSKGHALALSKDEREHHRLNAYHQVRLNTFWAHHKPAEFKLPAVRLPPPVSSPHYSTDQGNLTPNTTSAGGGHRPTSAVRLPREPGQEGAALE